MPKVRPEMKKQGKNSEKRLLECIAERFVATFLPSFGASWSSPRRFQKIVITSAHP